MFRTVVRKTSKLQNGSLLRGSKRFSSAPAAAPTSDSELGSFKFGFPDSRGALHPSSEFWSKEAEVGKIVNKSKLANGFTIVSTDSYVKGNAVVSLFVDAGSRYESFKNNGVSHYVQRFFFGPTNQRSYLRLATELQKTGANVSVQAGREEIVYRSESVRDAIPQVWSLVSNAILQGRLADWDLPPKRDAVKLDLAQFANSSEQVLNEVLHQTAFQGRTLGRSLVCPPHNVNKICVDTVAQYMDKLFTPERMTLVGTNLNHNDLQYLAEQLFGDMASGASVPIVKEKAQYCGGDAQVGSSLESCHGAKTHSIVAFEGANLNDKYYFANQVLANMLGEAYSRSVYRPTVSGFNGLLFEKVVTGAPSLVSAKAFHIPYSDSGLFGVYIAAMSSEKVGTAAQEAINVLRTIASSGAEASALEAAKKRTLLNFAIGLETGAGLNEFVAKNSLGQEEYVAAVQAVCTESLRTAAQAILKSRPTVVSLGSDLEKTFASHELKL